MRAQNQRAQRNLNRVRDIATMFESFQSVRLPGPSAGPRGNRRLITVTLGQLPLLSYKLESHLNLRGFYQRSDDPTPLPAGNLESNSDLNHFRVMIGRAAARAAYSGSVIMMWQVCELAHRGPSLAALRWAGRKVVLPKPTLSPAPSNDSELRKALSHET